MERLFWITIWEGLFKDTGYIVYIYIYIRYFMQRELWIQKESISTLFAYIYIFTHFPTLSPILPKWVADLIVVPSSVAQCWFIAADDRTPKHIHTNRQTAIPLYPGLLHFMTVANDNKDNSCVTILIGTFFTPQRGVKYLGYLVVILTKLKAFASQVASLCSRDGSRMMINWDNIEKCMHIYCHTQKNRRNHRWWRCILIR